MEGLVAASATAGAGDADAGSGPERLAQQRRPDERSGHLSGHRVPPGGGAG